MARPLIDRDATVEQLLDACEELIRQRGAVEIKVTDLAAACGMSQSNVYRFFPSKDALYEAMAERWFRELNDVMDEVTAANLPAREKMRVFFARRLAIKRERFVQDPALFRSYLALGEEHHEVVQGYIDLGDHYLSGIVAEAMAEGAFGGRAIDEVVPLINLMVRPFCDPELIVRNFDHATEANLATVIDVIFDGMRERREPPAPVLRLASEAA